MSQQPDGIEGESSPTELPGGDMEPLPVSIPDEDTQNAIVYDDALAEVTLAQRSRKSIA